MLLIFNFDASAEVCALTSAIVVGHKYRPILEKKMLLIYVIININLHSFVTMQVFFRWLPCNSIAVCK